MTISPPKHLSLAYDDYLDNPCKWEVGMRPPSFSVLAYQRLLDQITGVPGAITLKWAPDWKVFKARAIGETVDEETTPAQSALTDARGRSVAPPRWMLVERIEPEQYVRDWEKNRFHNDPRDLRLRDLRGPCPPEYFQWYATVAAHDYRCCEQRHAKNFVCWGYYKHPGEMELSKVARHWRKSLADPVNPHGSVDSIPETQHERDAVSDMRNEKERKKDENRLRAREMLSPFQPSELGQLLNAAKQRYCVAVPGKQIHHVVEKTIERERAENGNRVG